MQLENELDKFFLDKIRYEPEYYPFSMKFNTKLNSKLLDEAKNAGISEIILKIIRHGQYFNMEFHASLIKKLQSLLIKINLPQQKLLEFFMAMLNEQDLLIQEKYQKFLKPKELMSSFDRMFAVYFTKDNPNHPQHFTGAVETLVEWANIFLRYIFVTHPIYNSSIAQLDEDALFNLMREIIDTTNRYFGIKNHYDAAIFHNGKIDVAENGTILFDSKSNDLNLLELISKSIIDNQRMKSFDQVVYSLNKNPNLFSDLKNTVSVCRLP